MAAAAPAQAAVVPVPAPAPAPQSSAVAAAAPSKEAEKKVMEVDKKRLFVRWEVTDESLKSVFEQFGKVTETRVVRGPRLRAFGFLTFDSEESAAKAKDAMSGKLLQAGPLSIEFASAAGAARAREKKERPPRPVKERKPAPAGAGAGAASNAGNRSPPPAGAAAPGPARGGRRGGGRAPGAGAPAGGAAGGAAAGQPAGAAGAGAGAAAGAGAVAGRGRRRRGRGRNAGAGPATGGVAGTASDGKQRESRYNDPNWGKVVRLIPDPITTALPKDAAVVEVVAGDRTYKAGKTSADAKQIATLVLNADPTKGAFNCDFKLGNFALKLLEVKVTSSAGDTRVSCRVVHPDSGRNREVYLRVKQGEPPKHKFLELPTMNKDDTSPEVETFFVTVDSIQLNIPTGLWKRITMSLMSLMLPRRQQTQPQPR